MPSGHDLKAMVTEQLLKQFGSNPALASVVRSEVAAACAGKTRLSAVDMRILQQRIASLNIRGRNSRTGGAVSRSGPRARLPAKVTIASVPKSTSTATKPNRYGIPNRWGAGDPRRSRGGRAATRGRVASVRHAPHSSRPSTSGSSRGGGFGDGGSEAARPMSARHIDPHRLTGEILEEANPEVVLALVEEVKMQKEREARKKALVDEQRRIRETLQEQAKETKWRAQREKEEEAEFVALQKERMHEMEEKDRMKAHHARQRIEAEKEARNLQVAENRRMRARIEAEERDSETRQLQALEEERREEREQRARDAEHKRQLVAKQMEANDAALHKRAMAKERERKEDQEMMAAYNKMLEDQDRRRTGALAAIVARSDAIGDLATKNKEETLRRQKAEDARMVIEAERARKRAAEAEERERRERMALELETKKALDAQVALKKQRARAEKIKEREQSDLFKTRAAQMEAEQEEARAVEARRRMAYRRVLDAQREAKSTVAAKEVLRQKQFLSKQLAAVSDDPEILLEVQKRIRNAKMKKSPRY